MGRGIARFAASFQRSLFAGDALWQKYAMRAARRFGVALCALLAMACDKTGSHAAASSASPAPAPAPTKRAVPPEAPAPSASARSDESEETPHASKPGATSPWILDELADVGPAAPATASPAGVVMITRDDRALLARFDDKKLGRGDRPATTPVTPVTPGAAAFVHFAHGPAVHGGFAYFTSKGRLVRVRVDAEGAAEVLGSDARDGVRVAVAGDKPVTAAYVARGSDDSSTTARLWTEGAGTISVSPEGTSPSAVALVVEGGARLLLSLDGRTGMTPVHARRIEIAGGKPKPSEDAVVWIAGPSHSLTEVSALASDDDAWAFIPLERDITRFGLARIEIGERPHMGAPVVWRAYPNGLDPAPVATGRLCGGAVVLYARPADAAPGSPQELRLAPLASGDLGAGAVLARSRAFTDVSIAEVTGGALIAWVADHRTWAESVRCRGTRK